MSNPKSFKIATAWCELVGSFGGTPAASKTSGLAGSSRPSMIAVHFAGRLPCKRLAAAVMSSRVSEETLALGIVGPPGDEWVIFLRIIHHHTHHHHFQVQSKHGALSATMGEDCTKTQVLATINCHHLKSCPCFLSFTHTFLCVILYTCPLTSPWTISSLKKRAKPGSTKPRKKRLRPLWMSTSANASRCASWKPSALSPWTPTMTTKPSGGGTTA